MEPFAPAPSSKTVTTSSSPNGEAPRVGADAARRAVPFPSPRAADDAIASPERVVVVSMDLPVAAESFDPRAGEDAFAGLEPALLAMDAATVQSPNSDVALAAMAALALVREARMPERARRLSALPTSLTGGVDADGLEQEAWCLYYLDSRVRTVATGLTRAKIDADLADKASKLRTRMSTVLAYNFGDDLRMVAELDDIAKGRGYADLAQDLSRLAAHYHARRTQLETDRRQYDPKDEELARAYVNRIVGARPAPRDAQLVDLRNRAWTRMTASYRTLKAAADFAFMNSPTDLAAFPTLRAAVLAMSSKAGVSAEPAEEPLLAADDGDASAAGGVAPDAPSVAPSTPLFVPATPASGAPVPIGLPGSDPLVG